MNRGNLEEWNKLRQAFSDGKNATRTKKRIADSYIKDYFTTSGQSDFWVSFLRWFLEKFLEDLKIGLFIYSYDMFWGLLRVLHKKIL